MSILQSKKIGIIVLGCLLLLVISFFLFWNEDREYMAYKDFYAHVNLEEVKYVEIEDTKVAFQLVGDDKKYYTDNPQYEGFNEFLLLHQVKIANGFGMDELMNYFDIFFYLVFLGVIVFAAFHFTGLFSSRFKIVRHNPTKFSDVAGMEELKKDMIQLIDVVKNPLKYREKGIRPPKGIILEGPPGNGKTLLAKALAGEANMNFIATKGADFQSAMMSIGPQKIRSLFQKARRNKPCIIFIDEFDGIGERRNYAGTGIDKENNRLIITMLNEMDGFSNEEGVLVIAATNSFASLDAALIRPGRFDRKYRIDNPDKETILQLIAMYTKNKELDEKLNEQELAKCFGNLSAAGIETVLNEAGLIAMQKGKEKISIEDIAEAGKVTNTLKIILK